MEKEIKAIIFDWGGVFCSPGEPFSHSVFIRDLSLSSDEIGAQNRALQNDYYMGKITMDDFWKTLINKYNLTGVTIDDLSRAYLDSYATYPRMFELAKELRGKYKTLLLSNLTSEMMNDIKRKHNATGYFDHTIFSNEVGMMKPDPDIFTLALDILTSRPEETIFIDDSSINTKVAEEMGINTILFSSIQRFEEEMEKIIKPACP